MAPVTYKMTGYTKFSAEALSRIHPYTQQTLLIVLNSLIYFFISFDWISETECALAFESRSSHDMIDFTFKSVSSEANKLKETLDIKEWTSWLMGM
jgi:hypothetical protein